MPTIVVPFTHPPYQGAWSRALFDTKRAMATWWFSPLEILMAVVCALVAYLLLEGDARGIGTILSGLGGLVLAFLLVFARILVRTPYRQRDEARAHRDWIANSIGQPIQK